MKVGGSRCLVGAVKGDEETLECDEVVVGGERRGCVSVGEGAAVWLKDCRVVACEEDCFESSLCLQLVLDVLERLFLDLFKLDCSAFFLLCWHHANILFIYFY